MIWLLSVNLLAEGPDTSSAKFVAIPIEWWSALVGPTSTAIVDAIGLNRHWAGSLIQIVIWLGPIAMVLSMIWFLLIQRFVDTHDA